MAWGELSAHKATDRAGSGVGDAQLAKTARLCGVQNSSSRPDVAGFFISRPDAARVDTKLKFRSRLRRVDVDGVHGGANPRLPVRTLRVVMAYIYNYGLYSYGSYRYDCQ